MESESNDQDQNQIVQNNLYGKLKLLNQSNLESRCMSINFHPKGKVYATANSDGKINILRTRASAGQSLIITSLNDKKNHHNCCATAVRFRPWGPEDINPNNILIASFTNGRIKTFHYPSGKCVHKLNENRETITLEYSKFGDTFATSGNDGVLTVYDDETRSKIVEYKPPCYINASFRRMYAIAFHPRNTDELITGCWDGVVRYFDLRLPHLVKQVHGPKIFGEGLAINPRGTEVCTASWRRDDPLQLWDYGTGKLIRNVDFKTELSIEAATESSIDLTEGPRTSFSTYRESLPDNLVLPPILDSYIAEAYKAAKMSSFTNTSLTTLPKMLYSCKYIAEGDYIAVSGSSTNGALVLNKNTHQIAAAVGDLQHHVYSVDTFDNLLAITAGNSAALLECYKDQ